MKKPTSDNKYLQDKHLADFAKFLTDSLVKPNKRMVKYSILTPKPKLTKQQLRLKELRDIVKEYQNCYSLEDVLKLHMISKK